MPHFVQVVVLGSHPENRHRWHSGLAQFLGNANGRQRLVKRVRRPAQQSHLLPTDHGDRSTLQSLKIARRGLASAEPHVDIAQGRGRSLRGCGGKLQGSRRLLDRLETRPMGVEPRHAGKVIEKLEEQLWLVGQAPER